MIARGVAAVVAGLASAGVPATDNPSNVNPPGAYVQPRTLDGFTLGGSALLTVDVFLCAPANNRDRVETILADLLDKALTVLDPAEPITLNATLSLDVGTVPCYIIAATTETERT